MSATTLALHYAAMLAGMWLGFWLFDYFTDRILRKR